MYLDRKKNAQIDSGKFEEADGRSGNSIKNAQGSIYTVLINREDEFNFCKDAREEKESEEQSRAREKLNGRKDERAGRTCEPIKSINARSDFR